ncbi:hypothetical protein TNIN_144501 [Trichonephila inaurata madagascariensis]|uniref:Uncharacterized protein n=1 Tax=Trichonephila inaurata madagascariensis TaxID=2747483 RepID=A0A8X6Y4A7_9ARAC|nr:hypothetical protein TNIN_144501 [Trichonephila inaurata madagascariensis]
MHTKNSISNEDSLTGEKKHNISMQAPTNFKMFPSTSKSSFCASEKSSYFLVDKDMWSSLLCNIKCDECDMCSLDVECNGAYMVFLQK